MRWMLYLQEESLNIKTFTESHKIYHYQINTFCLQIADEHKLCQVFTS